MTITIDFYMITHFDLDWCINKLITDTVDVENPNTITNFQKIIDQIDLNKYVASYKWSFKTENKEIDEYHTFEFYSHLIRDFMYNIFRIKMWFYEITESNPNIFESIINLIEYFKQDSLNNKEEVLYLLKKAQEMIIGSQSQALDTNLLKSDPLLDNGCLPCLKLKFKDEEVYSENKDMIDPRMFLHLITKHIEIV